MNLLHGCLHNAALHHQPANRCVSKNSLFSIITGSLHWWQDNKAKRKPFLRRNSSCSLAKHLHWKGLWNLYGDMNIGNFQFFSSVSCSNYGLDTWTTESALCPGLLIVLFLFHWFERGFKKAQCVCVGLGFKKYLRATGWVNPYCRDTF